MQATRPLMRAPRARAESASQRWVATRARAAGALSRLHLHGLKRGSCAAQHRPLSHSIDLAHGLRNGDFGRTP